MKHIHRSTAWLLLLWVSVANGQLITPLVVGGKQVKATEWIGERVVGLLNRGEPMCTATILTSQTALTAAHCVDGGGSFELGFAVSVNSSRITKRKVTKALIHPRYDDKFRSANPSDIALLFYAGGLPSSHKKVGIASSKQLPRVGETVTVAGYGTNRRDGSSGYGILRKADLQMAGVNSTQSEVVLNQAGSKAVCYGDSGGPVFMKDPSTGSLLQLGIASRVTAREHKGNVICDDMATYTRVSYFKSWIDQNAR